MCVDYTDLNKACLKDPYLLPSIDGLVDAASGFRFLSFMDAYSGYNQIPMHRFNEEKPAFITPMANYCYKVLPFGLKNVGATYQRLMNKVFAGLIENLMEVYIDDMLIKMEEEGSLLSDLDVVFDRLRQHNMRLNPHKCSFAVASGKFLGFMLTHRGIEVNPDKCRAILKMKSPMTVKEVQRLIRRIASLSRFMAALARRARPFFSLLRKGNTFEWTSECEAAFDKCKKYLSHPRYRVSQEAPVLIPFSELRSLS